MNTQRGGKIIKGYLYTFVCCVTKGVHLEFVSDLSSDLFIVVFRRFIAKREHCIRLYSDCFSNFIGSNNNNKLQEISEFASEHLNIIWNFSPASAPDFNELSEADQTC